MRKREQEKEKRVKKREEVLSLWMRKREKKKEKRKKKEVLGLGVKQRERHAFSKKTNMGTSNLKHEINYKFKGKKNIATNYFTTSLLQL